MGERLDFNPEEMPRMMLSMPNGEFEATPINTTLFTYLGRLACYNHVFIQTGDEDKATIIGAYIFNQHTVYTEIANFMKEANFPMVLNRIEVPDCDVNAFDKMVKQQTMDIEFIPDDWK